MESKVEKLLYYRLGYLEYYAKQGVVPGELDSIELDEMIGRIKELKYVLGLMKENCSTPVERAHSDGFPLEI